MSTHSSVVILDYGSQYTQLITRRIRELGIYSVILPGDATLQRIEKFSPKAVILSGGPNSVYDPGAPTLPAGFLEYQARQKVPVLGICYGMQLLARTLGGEVHQAHAREYGRMEVLPMLGSQFFAGALSSPFQAWMSHGDETRAVPAGFKLVAQSASGAAAAMENPSLSIYALQFHPEVTHTEGGKELLRHFLVNLAHIQPDWNMASVLEEQIALIREKVGPTAHVLCGLSGGVDSTVAATLVHRAIGDRLHCVFVDHGMLRHEEGNRVMKMFEERLHLVDPEQKRKIIGAEFIRVFEESAELVGKQVASATGKAPAFLVQGTLYPDVIESSPPPGAVGGVGDGRKHSATIKSHHNVGGLPKDLKFELIEPLRQLFKDEVRELGRTLSVPEDFLRRHPFPGPGLAVRIIGDITPERVKVLQLVDEIFIQSIRDAGLYDKIWQAMAIFLPVKSVGVQGDGRTHDHVVALRAVTSSDGMTADWYPFEHKFLAQVSGKICNEVRGVNRVVYDISSKPPATIEWE